MSDKKTLHMRSGAIAKKVLNHNTIWHQRQIDWKLVRSPMDIARDLHIHKRLKSLQLWPALAICISIATPSNFLFQALEAIHLFIIESHVACAHSLLFFHPHTSLSSIQKLILLHSPFSLSFSLSSPHYQFHNNPISLCFLGF